ncbi:hypothetical protein RFI_34928, partial [Reticulomyxa filosa]
QIDANLIYVALQYLCKGDVNLAIQLLSTFEQWKFRNNNEQDYKKRINEFLERRCCNHNVNLFFIFFSQIYKERTEIKNAVLNIAYNGLPFVKKDKMRT